MGSVFKSIIEQLKKCPDVLNLNKIDPWVEKVGSSCD